jgi:formiminoglutamase
MIEVVQGHSPLVLGLPHTGSDVPPAIWSSLNENGRALTDTDWHIDALYRDLVSDVTTVRTPIHRYVIDVNRDPEGQSLYPGQNTTGLCPETDFDGQPIYQEDATPGREEIDRRRQAYHAPYHAALLAELTRIKALHGFAILYDCHSIRFEVPFLFPGRLPDFNIGTNLGQSCDPSIERGVAGICQAAPGYTTVVNGRFRGGWTTRHYGRPDAGIHAIQMELAQSTYMAEHPPWRWDAAKAAALRTHLREILTKLKTWRPT